MSSPPVLPIRHLTSQDADFWPQLNSLLAYEPAQDAQIDARVTDILQAVKRGGNETLRELTQRYDHWLPATDNELEIPRAQWQQALQDIPANQRTALEQAAARIRAYHERQLQSDWQYREPDGTILGQKITPLDRVGLYVPGGKAAYPSSVLMNALAAKVAGVAELIMVSPTPGGAINQTVLAAAALAGVDRLFRIGGGQAIAALAYGTATVPAVDKIVGPGNAYVAAAKRRVFGTVGIDMIAGPSEILIICDGATPPDWVAMDLFSQAEHDEIAQAILLCPDRGFIERVKSSIDALLPGMPRAEIIRASLGHRGALIEVRDLDEACAIANHIAPEHLELSVADPQVLLPKIKHAGAIFMGAYSSEALGDYCAGPNHVLPTARTARFSSPLSVHDFQKRSSIIHVSPEGAETLGHIAITLAHAEGLPAHAQSAAFRLNS